jgi:antitoxin ParD1/3/4
MEGNALSEDTGLSEQQRLFVDRQVAAGHYGSPREVLADALRLLEDREERLAGLDAAIAEGVADLDQNQGRDAAHVFDALEQKYRPAGLVRRAP